MNSLHVLIKCMIWDVMAPLLSELNRYRSLTIRILGLGSASW